MDALGAVPIDDRLVAFRVWAPNASSVAVRLHGEDQELAPAGDGVWEGELAAWVGDDYLYVLDREHAWPDPCSRCQPEGVRGPSKVMDTARLADLTNDFGGLSVDDLVAYELHVGTFTPEGTFDAAIARLPELRELGVTAVEVMPVATFPGNRGWGYDGLYTWAPHHAYGGPEAFARFVHAAHECELGVILDVVYNHVGPGSEALSAFGPYFTNRYDTFWGDAIDYSQRGVREWALQNAELWVRDYGVDGLRLDAVHAIHDDESAEHVMAELVRRVRAASPRAIVTSEIEIGDRRPIEEWGHDAQWDDSFHHALWVLLTGERDGYYAPFGTVMDLARAYVDEPPEKLIVCAQNHDQVGNRAQGDRLSPEHRVIAAICTLFAPHSLLLFQGEEYGEENPFQFFTDHIDQAIAEATREGRRREFEGFAGFDGDVPDPQAEETFLRSKVDPSQGNGQLRELYATLLKLRRELPREVEATVDEEARVLRVRRGPVELFADFANAKAELRS